MSETVNQENATNNTQEPQTFTQEQLDKIVADRLARERKKYEGVNLEELQRKASEFDKLEEANKTDLEKAQKKIGSLQAELDSMRKAEAVKAAREKVAKETGVPANLLTAEDEDACMEQAKAIKAFAVPEGYPVIKDGGEVQITQKRSARDDFASWANTINS